MQVIYGDDKPAKRPQRQQTELGIELALSLTAVRNNQKNNNPKKDRQEHMKLNAIKTGKNSKLGIAMTEYLIILGVVAVAAILVVGLFGKQIKSVFTRNNAALTGQTVAADTATVTTSKGATVQENMGSFDAQASKKGQ